MHNQLIDNMITFYIFPIIIIIIHSHTFTQVTRLRMIAQTAVNSLRNTVDNLVLRNLGNSICTTVLNTQIVLTSHNTEETLLSLHHKSFYYVVCE